VSFEGAGKILYFINHQVKETTKVTMAPKRKAATSVDDDNTSNKKTKTLSRIAGFMRNRNAAAAAADTAAEPVDEPAPAQARKKMKKTPARAQRQEEEEEEEEEEEQLPPRTTTKGRRGRSKSVSKRVAPAPPPEPEPEPEPDPQPASAKKSPQKKRRSMMGRVPLGDDVVVSPEPQPVQRQVSPSPARKPTMATSPGRGRKMVEQAQLRMEPEAEAPDYVSSSPRATQAVPQYANEPVPRHQYRSPVAPAVAPSMVDSPPPTISPAVPPTASASRVVADFQRRRQASLSPQPRHARSPGAGTPSTKASGDDLDEQQEEPETYHALFGYALCVAWIAVLYYSMETYSSALGGPLQVYTFATFVAGGIFQYYILASRIHGPESGGLWIFISPITHYLDLLVLRGCQVLLLYVTIAFHDTLQELTGFLQSTFHQAAPVFSSLIAAIFVLLLGLSIYSQWCIPAFVSNPTMSVWEALHADPKMSSFTWYYHLFARLLEVAVLVAIKIYPQMIATSLHMPLLLITGTIGMTANTFVN